jgi:putative ABC transport system permease protein
VTTTGSWERLGIGVAVLLAVTLVVLGAAGIAHRRSVLTATVRAAAQLTIVALALRGVFAAPLAVIAVIGVMLFVAIWTASRRLANLDGARVAVTLACVTGTAVSVGIIVGLPVLDRSLRDLVAVAGIIVGGTMTAATLAGRHLEQGLRLRHAEVEGWLALGATHRVAARDIARQAVYEALVPALDQTRTVGLVSLPGAFVGALLSGAAVQSAARFQFAVLVGLLCAESISAAMIAYRLGAPKVFPQPA